MKTEAQRIAIAEACGTMKWSYALPKKCTGCGVPEYPSDLNAMHGAEKVLNTKALWETYKAHLLNWMTEPVCASAAQRAEAFLKTLNLWTP